MVDACIWNKEARVQLSGTHTSHTSCILALFNSGHFGTRLLHLSLMTEIDEKCPISKIMVTINF
jgi:hypothetical protein